jgi:hypothetical protein
MTLVGSYNDNSTGVEHGYLYSHGTYITLDDPAGKFTKPLGIVGITPAAADIWTGSSMTMTGSPQSTILWA